MTKEFTILVTGESQSDVEMGLEEVLKLVKEGYLSGHDSNETGEYFFDSKGKSCLSFSQLDRLYHN